MQSLGINSESIDYEVALGLVINRIGHGAGVLVPRHQMGRSFNGTRNYEMIEPFGGTLTALRYPEREIVDVPSHRSYAEPSMEARVNPPPSSVAAGDS